MKKNIRTGIALFMAMAMSFSLFGCGQSGSSQSSGGTSTSQGSSASQSSSTSGSSAAEDIAYPEREITIVVPFAAGGVTDVAARKIADAVSEKWGQPITILNQTGVIPTTVEALGNRPDGYTLSVIPYAEACSAIATALDPPIDVDNTTFVAQLTRYPVSFTVNADAEWETFADLCAWVQEHSSELTWGGNSMSSTTAMIVAQWLDSIGCSINEARMVTGTGASDFATKVAGGHVMLQVGDIVSAESLIEAGRLKSLGMTPYRPEAYPDIPVIQESGVEGVENMTIGNGVSLIAPGGLPEEIVQKWNDTLEELYQDETFLQEMADLGLMPDYKSSADFEAFFRENLETIRAVAEKNNLVH